MAYLNSNTTFVEINRSVPIHFRLNSQLIGLNNFGVYLQNKETVRITRVDADIQEYNVFRSLSTLNGAHVAGTTTIRVMDASLFTVNDIIRFDNSIFKVVSIDLTNHVLTLDGTLTESYPDQYPVAKVLYPEFLGCYWFTLRPTELGNFIVNIVDHSGVVGVISDDLQVVTSLNNTVLSQGFIGSNRGTIG